MVLLTVLLKYLLQKQQTELSHCAPAMHLEFKCIFIPTSSLLFSIEAGLPLGSLLLPVDRNSRSALKCKEHDKFFTFTSQHCLCFTWTERNVTSRDKLVHNRKDIPWCGMNFTEIIQKSLSAQSLGALLLVKKY